MLDEPEPGRLAVWRVHNGQHAVQLHIDLDHDQAVTVTIDRDGRATAMLSDRVAEWLTKEVASSCGNVSRMSPCVDTQHA